MNVTQHVRSALKTVRLAILGDRLDRRLSDVIGLARGGSGHSRRTGDAFRERLKRRA